MTCLLKEASRLIQQRLQYLFIMHLLPNCPTKICYIYSIIHPTPEQINTLQQQYQRFSEKKRKEIHTKYWKIFVELFDDLFRRFHSYDETAQAFIKIWEQDLNRIVDREKPNFN